MALKNKINLGQHWLKNRDILDEIARLADIGVVDDDMMGSVVNESACVSSGNRDDVTCLEIGPGLGFLTSSLLRHFKKVIAVEYDEELARKLPGSFPGKNLEVVAGDILQFDFAKMAQPYVVVGNIPYYITSPIIERVLTVPNLPERVVLLMQKEVAERILSERESKLSLFVKNRAEVFAGSVVLAKEFTPPPKVDSEVVVFKPHEPRVQDGVFRLIQRGFVAPRKKLIHNLTSIASRENLKGIFMKNGFSLDARPGDLHLEDWEKLFCDLNLL